ncbi:Transcriptional activator spt7 [Phlyctochytrium planicorne]|nr:Transcriptional activator spt7 [Phlyctochytrium planicorne]
MYLTRQEFQMLRHAASSKEIWDAFMDDPHAVAWTDETLSEVSKSAIIVAAFRIRTMIFEQRIPEIYPQCSFSSVMLPGEGPSTAGGVHEGREELSDYIHSMVPIDDMFYSLEHDIEAMKEITKIKTENFSKTEQTPEVVHHEPSKEKVEIKPEDASSLQYLFDVISQNFPSQKAGEMKVMVSNLRRSRSKWAHDYRIGQEQLYDALEKEHSEPFLVKVNKKDVPDYYDIIKEPMDLGTMTKKLAGLAYLSKEEFSKDLYLIWSNCLIYNTAPDSIYRKKAMAMKRRTTELLKKVPDIKIEIKPQEEPEYESEEEPEEDTKNQLFGSRSFPSSSKVPARDYDNDAKPERADSTYSISGLEGQPSSKKSVTGRIQTSPDPNDGVKKEDDADSMDLDFGSVAQKQRKTQDGQPPNGFDSGMVSDEDNESVTEQVVPMLGTFEERAIEEEAESLDLQQSKWKEETLSQRVELCIVRDLQQAVPFPERNAIETKPSDFRAFVDSFEEYKARNEKRRELINNRFGNGNLEDSKTFLKSFLPELTHTTSSLPNSIIPFINTNTNTSTNTSINNLYPNPSMSEYALDDLSLHTRLGLIINRNIHSLRKIKQAHSKILAKESSGSSEDVFGPFCKRYQRTRTKEELPDLIINSRSAEALLGQVVSKLLAHAGFDSASQSALGIITGIGAQYLHNLGKTLRLYIDKYKATVPPEKILDLSLKSNGVDIPDKLNVYLRFDVERYGAKLYDLRRRLEAAYKQLLEVTGNGQMEDDVDLDDAQEQIYSGNFFEEFGFDVLQLKDIGIDIGSVPTELWNKKAERPVRLKRRLLLAHSTDTAQAVTKYRVAEPWKPVDPANVIKLLEPFYAKKVAEGDMMEDDDKPKGKPLKSKVLLKVALLGRKKALAADPAKARPVDPVKAAEKAAKEAAKRKREADRIKSKEEKEAAKKKREADRMKLKEEKDKEKDKENQ